MIPAFEPTWLAEIDACYTELARPLYGYAFLLTRRDREQSEDLVQEAFVRLSDKWGEQRQRTREQQHRWLMRVTRNVYVDLLRREMTRHRLLPLVDGLAHAIVEPGEAALVRMALDQCWKVIGQMSAHQHLVVVLRWWHVYTYAEIAEELGISTKTVSSYISDARRQLAAAVGQELPFELRKRYRRGEEG